jgi:hypothetical protein
MPYNHEAVTPRPRNFCGLHDFGISMHCSPTFFFVCDDVTGLRVFAMFAHVQMSDSGSDEDEFKVKIIAPGAGAAGNNDDNDDEKSVAKLAQSANKKKMALASDDDDDDDADDNAELKINKQFADKFEDENRKAVLAKSMSAPAPHRRTSTNGERCM